jgi:hypothetical protein
LGFYFAFIFRFYFVIFLGFVLLLWSPTLLIEKGALGAFDR